MLERPTLHEQTFQRGLAQAIRLRKPSWAAGSGVVQVTSRRVLSSTSARPDILIDDPLLPPIVIEVSCCASDAERDARNRIGRSLIRGSATIHAAIALRIPASHGNMRCIADVTDRLVDGDCVEYAFLQGFAGKTTKRWPATGLIKGQIDDLVSIIPAVSQTSESIAGIANYAADQVKQCAQHLLARTSAISQASIASSVRQRMPWNGLTTASVLWLNALVSQLRLSYSSGNDSPSLSGCRDATGKPLPHLVADAWRAALQVNFRSIFGPALASLIEAIDASAPGTSEGLECLFKAAEGIQAARLGSYIDIGAELFPRLSDDRKTSAAFYTKPSAAELLACLTIREEVEGGIVIPWGNRRLGRMIRIADAACGTGTLVRAGYRQIRHLHEKHGGNSARLHRDFMEHGVVALDISAIAAHLTATTLSAMEPGVPYADVQIGCMPVGGSGRTGSLEFLQSDEIGDLFQHSFEASRGRGAGGQVTSAKLPTQGLDFFLANPPYSRTRGGQSLFDVAGLTKEERIASQKRVCALGRQTCANLRAGLATYFLAMADQKLRPGGTMGFVLPLTAASAHSYRPVRRMIEQRYRNVIALTIAGGATGKTSLSSDTGMGEMLLVATKAPVSQEKPGSIVCVTLYEGLTEIGQARETARAAIKSIQHHAETENGRIVVGRQEIGSWVRRSRTGRGEPWSELGSVHGDLAVAAERLLRGKLTDLRQNRTLALPVRMVELGDLFQIGPTHHRIGHLAGNGAIGAFEFHPLDPAYPVVQNLAVWQANSKEQRSLRVSPTHFGVDPRDPDRALQKRMRSESGTLFYARNLRWTSQALVAVTTEHEAMGGPAWIVLGQDDERIRKSFALWANSTLGLLVQWTQGGKQQQGRTRVQVNAIQKIPVPDLRNLSPERLEFASQAFDTLRDRELRPACQAHADEARKSIDRAVLAMFGFLDATAWQSGPGGSELGIGIERSIANLRVEFCEEPQIHGHNRQALSLLETRRDT